MTERDWERFLSRHPLIFFFARVFLQIVWSIRATVRFAKYVLRRKRVRQRAKQFHLYRINKPLYFLKFWPKENESVHSRSKIKALYAENPAVFQNAWRRVKTDKVKKLPEYNQTARLWMTLNIVDVVLQDWRKCYYCWAPYDIEDYLLGKMEVEHMVPLSMNGKHLPENIVIACRDCNRLKKNLTNEEIVQIYRNPGEYFTRNHYKPEEKAKLQDFMGMSVYGLIPNEEFFDTRGIEPRNWTPYITDLKKKYRDRWRRSRQSA